MGRTSAVLIVSAALVAWFETAPHLGRLSEWKAVVAVAVCVLPGMFALAYLALPLCGERWLPVAAGALALLAVGLSVAHQPVFSNLAKFAAVTSAGWAFMQLFETLAWAVLIAAVIPWVDAYSVWRGPTHSITQHHAAVFTSLSVAFVAPGGASARLGVPDVFFFAVFLATSVRFGLRPLPTWLAMVASLGLTIAATTYWTTNGLPALPAISFGFLAANADLVWRRLRRPPGGTAIAT